MNIETAFVLGVLVGHWILLWAIWRAIEKLVKILSSMETLSEIWSPDSNEIVYIQQDDPPIKE